MPTGERTGKMASVKYLFKIRVKDIRDVEWEVESILCDEYSIMHGAKEGFDRITVGVGGNCPVDLRGEFIVESDDSSLPVTAMDIRRMIYKAAGRYVETEIEIYPVEGGYVFTGSELEFARMKAHGELDDDLDDMEEFDE